MDISTNTQAVLLLTSHFSKGKTSTAKPLTPTEWGRFALWLKENELRPSVLIDGSEKDPLANWSDVKVSRERLEALVARGSALALAVEKWLRIGLWVMTRSDSDYPKRLKSRLGTLSPAVLFGCGNRALLQNGGLAVVGSRKADSSDLQYARDLGGLAANHGYSVISGGARGVDEASMLGALDAEGTVIGVLADSLLKSVGSAKYRAHLRSGNLVLVSATHPEAGFNAGNAMQRNKYIYCLSDSAVVVHSGPKGGTWSGALENLKKGWVPLWVKDTDDTTAGNAAIVDSGGLRLEADVLKIDIARLFSPDPLRKEPESDLFAR